MARFRAVGCVTRHRSRPFPGPAATSAPRRLPRVSDPRGADEFARGASAATLRVATVPRPNRSAAAPCPAHGTRNGFSSRFRLRRIARETPREVENAQSASADNRGPICDGI